MIRDAMKQALEALETCKVYDEADAWFDIDKVGDASDALRLAIEQAERQEPVAWLTDSEEIYFDKEDARRYSDGFIQPLYTAPPQRGPLTDERLRKMHHEDQFGLFCDYDEFEQIARAVERKHGIGA